MRSDRGHILLAEDSPVSQRVASAMLEHLGFRVNVAGDGAAAVKAVKAAVVTPYQAVLMDCQLPILDGYQATTEIRRIQGATRRTPIIAVTGSGMMSNHKRCLAVGMDDYVAKPLSLESLSTTLARWVPALSAVDDDGAAGPVAPGVAVIDPEVVASLERLGRDVGEDLVGQLTGLFLTSAGAALAALRDASAVDDSQAVARAAHTLCGASANVGATELARLCADLSTSAASAAPAGDRPLLGAVAAVQAEFGRVRAALAMSRPTGATA
jgi:CheY-like chemotaxis protein/HPt (histidine-containing phosphotransfer) domain-containing protein